MSARRRPRNGLVPRSDAETIALGYGRVSSDEQYEEGVSLPAQAEVRRRYIAGRPDWVVGDELEDVLSGQRDDRPDYRRLLMTARSLVLAGRRVAIVVSMLDRLGRRAVERLRAYDELTELGVEIHSVHEGGLVGELMYKLLSILAEQETRNLQLRVKQSIRHFEEHGWQSPGSRAWGYGARESTAEEKALQAPKTVLIPHEVEAPYVREAWRRYADGASIRSIARWAAGLPSDARGGRNLAYPVLRKLLRSPVYVARCGGADLHPDADLLAVLEEQPGRWEPLIDDDTWARAARQTTLGRRLPRQASGSFALTGILRCDRCGTRMSGRTQKTYDSRRTAYRRQYVCNAKSQLGAATGGATCSRVVSAAAIERPVIETVKELARAVKDPETRRAYEREYARRRRAAADDGASVVRRIGTLEAERQRLTAARAGLSVKLSVGELGKLEYDEAVAYVRAEIERIDDDLGRLRGRVKRADDVPMEALLAQLAGWDAVIEDGEPHAQRAAFATLFSTVTPHALGAGRYEVRLDFTPLGMRALQVGLARRPSENLVSVGSLGLTKLPTPTRPAVARRAS